MARLHWRLPKFYAPHYSSWLAITIASLIASYHFEAAIQGGYNILGCRIAISVFAMLFMFFLS